MVRAENIRYSYDGERDSLAGVNFHSAPGALTVVLGRNGCGKSTFVKQLNALLTAQSGSVEVAGMDASDPDNVWRLRRKVGMVFQNPDNQFVSTIVAEDVAFGLENYGVAQAQIPERVSEALAAVGMAGYENRSPHMLSGGQKQRVALAGVLALDPDVLVFDEATSMLDPEGRQEILHIIQTLHQQGKTVIMITHYVEEAVFADRVYLMSDGKMIANGPPNEILTNRDLLAQAGLLPPLTVRLWYDLREHGIALNHCPLTSHELVEEICQLK